MGSDISKPWVVRITQRTGSGASSSREVLFETYAEAARFKLSSSTQNKGWEFLLYRFDEERVRPVGSPATAKGTEHRSTKTEIRTEPPRSGGASKQTEPSPSTGAGKQAEPLRNEEAECWKPFVVRIREPGWCGLIRSEFRDVGFDTEEEALLFQMDAMKKGLVSFEERRGPFVVGTISRGDRIPMEFMQSEYFTRFATEAEALSAKESSSKKYPNWEFWVYKELPPPAMSKGTESPTAKPKPAVAAQRKVSLRVEQRARQRAAEAKQQADENLMKLLCWAVIVSPLLLVFCLILVFGPESSSYTPTQTYEEMSRDNMIREEKANMRREQEEFNDAFRRAWIREEIREGKH